MASLFDVLECCNLAKDVFRSEISNTSFDPDRQDGRE